MSVLFRNMRMPKECRICPMLGYESDIGRTRCVIACRILSEHYKPIPFDGRPEWCPASEVKEPHGDLIDKDVLLDDLLIHADSYFADFARLWTNKQPAVIEAEGAEE